MHVLISKSVSEAAFEVLILAGRVGTGTTRTESRTHTRPWLLGACGPSCDGNPVVSQNRPVCCGPSCQQMGPSVYLHNVDVFILKLTKPEKQPYFYKYSVCILTIDL